MKRPNFLPHELRPHDLLWIAGARAVVADMPAPAWVGGALAAQAVVVVRRSRAAAGMVAVGVRGSARAQRFAGAVSAGAIIRRVRPEDLPGKRYQAAQARCDAIPALRGYRAVEAAWAALPLPWGPVGSVGFELATGLPAATATSDVDLVVYAASRLSVTECRALLQTVEGVDAVADIQVEVPAGSFSLREFCAGRTDRCLLKTVDGPQLVDDPWLPTIGVIA